MAIVSGIVRDDGSLIIVSADSSDRIVKDEEQSRYIKEHISKLRDIPVLMNAHIICIIESNFGGAIGASVIASICGEFQPCSALTRDTSKVKRCGVFLNDVIKVRLVTSVRAMLL